MAENTGSKPNVIWVFGDQHRAQALGCMGDPNLATPNIDRLAAEGVTFSAAVSYSMIENLDWNVGRIMQALDETGLRHSTHVLFFSDHGDMQGSHGQFRKTTPWEEAIRVPFIIGGHVPFYVNKLGRFPVPINHVDVAPTTLGLCGISAPEWMQGIDFSGYRIRGRHVRNEPDSAFLQLVRPTGHPDSVDRAWRGLVTRDGWKYVVLEGQPLMLYNLNEDPYELANQALNPAYSRERARLQDRLAAWISDSGDSFLLPEL